MMTFAQRDDLGQASFECSFCGVASPKDHPGHGLPRFAKFRVWPLIVMLALGATIASYISFMSWASVAPRPSYGRAFTIVGITIALTAIGLVVTRVYWSRQFLIVTVMVWLILMLTYRLVLRRRPWTERMVLVTGEESLAKDLRRCPAYRCGQLLSSDRRPTP